MRRHRDAPGPKRPGAFSWVRFAAVDCLRGVFAAVHGQRRRPVLWTAFRRPVTLEAQQTHLPAHTMNKKHVIIALLIGAVIGTAYGSAIPGLNYAKKLPGATL